MGKWNGSFRSDRSNREKRSTSKGGLFFSKLFRLDRTDPFSFRPKFPEILVEWIAPKVLTGQFQTVGVVLASDWCQKTFVFFCPITEQQNQELFRVFPHKPYIQASCSPYLSGSFAKGLLEEKSPNHSTKCSGDFSPYPHETRLKYAGPFAGIVLTLLYLKLASFCTLTDVDKYNFSANFLDKVSFFLPVFCTSIAVTETFPIPSNLSSHGPSR